MKFTRRAALAAPALLLATRAGAQGGFPNRAVRMIVPYTPGGVSDITARLIADPLAATWGHPVPVENRAGAGGVVGADAVAKAAPDGYTLLLGSNGPLTNAPVLQARLPYDLEKDFAAIAMISRSPVTLSVRADSPFRNLADLLAAARAKPGDLSIGSSGQGSATHFLIEQVMAAAGIRLTHVPYRGGAPLTTALVQNEVQVGLADLPILLPQIRAGTIRALAVGSAQRLPWLPDVPTMIELGYPSVDTNNWHGFVAPSRIPEPILERLHGALAGALKDPEISRQLFDQGAVPGGNSRAEFGEFIKAEMAKWGEVIRRGNIRAD